MIDILKNMLDCPNPKDLMMSESLNNMPLHLHYKDKKGRYIDFNERVLVDCGLSQSIDLRGLTDYDFKFLKDGEALNIQNRDKEVIAKDISTIKIGSLTLHDNIIAQEISIKNPLRSKFTKKIIGVTTCAFVLRENSQFYDEFIKDSNNNFLSTTNFNMADEEYKKLSSREKQCLELYLSGASGKETASILGISHRTVEDYINSIKKKLKCNRKRDLIKLFNSLNKK